MGSEPAHRDSRNHQLVGSPRRRWERRGIELGERSLGFVNVSDQEEAPHLQVPCVRGVPSVLVPFERGPRRLECFGGPAQVARYECDFGLRDDAPRARYRVLRAEGTRRASDKSLGSGEVTELGHRDASKGKGRGVIAQGDTFQRAEGIAGCQRACRGRDHRVHRNPATLVTPALPTGGASVTPDQQPE